jgi:hypothetical protein
MKVLFKDNLKNDVLIEPYLLKLDSIWNQILFQYINHEPLYLILEGKVNLQKTNPLRVLIWDIPDLVVERMRVILKQTYQIIGPTTEGYYELLRRKL